MIDKNDIPMPWLDALAVIKLYCPEAMLAGGALRDLDNGREVKDLDIFVKGGKLEALYQLHSRMSSDGIYVEDIDPDAQYPIGDGNDVTGYFTCGFEGLDKPVQIIMVDYPFEILLERFDYGICRILYDGKQLHVHADYIEDQEAQVFRLRRERNNIELSASVHRYARIVQKYEGWRWLGYEKPFNLWPLEATQT